MGVDLVFYMPTAEKIKTCAAVCSSTSVRCKNQGRARVLIKHGEEDKDLILLWICFAHLKSFGLTDQGEP